MGEERKAPSKVTEGLNIDEKGKAVFRKNEKGETEIYRKWGAPGEEEWHGPYGPGAEEGEESPDIEEGDEVEE